MKREHTEKFIIKIADEYGYTRQEIRNQVNNYLGLNLTIYGAIEYLKQFNAESIRFILGFNKL